MDTIKLLILYPITTKCCNIPCQLLHEVIISHYISHGLLDHSIFNEDTHLECAQCFILQLTVGNINNKYMGIGSCLMPVECVNMMIVGLKISRAIVLLIWTGLIIINEIADLMMSRCFWCLYLYHLLLLHKCVIYMNLLFLPLFFIFFWVLTHISNTNTFH